MTIEHIRNESYEESEREVRGPVYRTLPAWAMVPLSDVLKQATARIFRGNTHRESELFILFEPLTQVIRKGKAGKPNEFGKMVNRRR